MITILRRYTGLGFIFGAVLAISIVLGTWQAKINAKEERYHHSLTRIPIMVPIPVTLPMYLTSDDCHFPHER